MLIYAEDVAIFFMKIQDQETERKTKEDLNIITKWSDTFKLTLNEKKYHLINIWEKKNYMSLSIHLNSTTCNFLIFLI